MSNSSTATLNPGLKLDPWSNDLKLGLLKILQDLNFCKDVSELIISYYIFRFRIMNPIETGELYKTEYLNVFSKNAYALYLPVFDLGSIEVTNKVEPLSRPSFYRSYCREPFFAEFGYDDVMGYQHNLIHGKNVKFRIAKDDENVPTSFGLADDLEIFEWELLIQHRRVIGMTLSGKFIWVSYGSSKYFKNNVELLGLDGLFLYDLARCYKPGQLLIIPDDDFPKSESPVFSLPC